MTNGALDRDEFRKLFQEHYNLICNYLNKRIGDWELSQEIAQNTFVKLWEKREEITINTSRKSYLFQIARNALIDHFRSQKIAAGHAESYSSSMEESEHMPDIDEEGFGVTQQIAEAVDKLKPKTRKIFLLSKKEGLTYDEIADYLDISKRTVEYNMKNALQQLKELLEGKI